MSMRLVRGIVNVVEYFLRCRHAKCPPSTFCNPLRAPAQLGLQDVVHLHNMVLHGSIKL